MSWDVLVIDPPWPKRKGGLRTARPNQERELSYPTLSVAAIFVLLDIDVLSQASQTHCVFMWTVDQFLADAESAMYARGYKRHARIIWDKGNGVAPAFTIRYTHEYLIWFYKPKLLPVDTGARGKQGTVIRAGNREHSRKPDEAYKYVEFLYPQATKVDVFSREPREGWEQWGNECDKFTRVAG